MRGASPSPVEPRHRLFSTLVSVSTTYLHFLFHFIGSWILGRHVL
ncbi:hypothetical protein SLEP1_g4577 [Rubroshorea leprosula]|uniref:Uncharacterized protein n=1 Tax=Rubroshorea leprosula TaxID=152421 RepID=A0AAV5HUX9_9ROSI|nr:hypothetical protein SLEP1_g4577 [Rubroshorea leprosula]